MLTTQDLHAIQSGQHADPYAVLGLHTVDGRLWAHAFLPGAQRVVLLDRSSGRPMGDMVRAPGTDVFSLSLSAVTAPFAHQFEVHWADGQTARLEDPFAYGTVLGELDVWLLSEGTHQRPYECLGAHPRTLEGV